MITCWPQTDALAFTITAVEAMAMAPKFIDYKGERYRLQTSGRYYQAQEYKKGVERLLHRRIWIEHHGPIPPGYEVHHVNGDWADSRIENLELIEGREHARMHMLERNSTEEGRARTLAGLAQAREAAREWHASEEGRQWHVEHGKRTWEGREPVQATCVVCAKTFDAFFSSRVRYCSSACAQTVRFRTYFTDERKCEHCGQTFMANRHRRTRFCSRTCSARAEPRGRAKK